MSSVLVGSSGVLRIDDGYFVLLASSSIVLLVSSWFSVAQACRSCGSWGFIVWLHLTTFLLLLPRLAVFASFGLSIFVCSFLFWFFCNSLFHWRNGNASPS